MNIKTDSLAHLKRRVDALSRSDRSRSDQAEPAGLFTLGHDGIDARLGGGLARGALHEVLGADAAVASGFALMLALRTLVDGKPILWVMTDRGERQSGALYGPGLAELGADPDRIMTVHAPDELSALRAGADILGCTDVGVAIIEAGDAKKLDLTASRRLALAADKNSVTCVITRAPSSVIASAASTRWSVAAAPSTMLPGDAPGQTCLHLSLLRHRGGVAPFDMTLEWNRDQILFVPPAFASIPASAPLSRPLSAPPQRRQMAA
jgi:protein ImuA